MQRDYALYEKENQEFNRLIKFEVDKYRPQACRREREREDAGGHVDGEEDEGEEKMEV